MLLKTVTSPFLDAHTYLVGAKDGAECVVIDPGIAVSAAVAQACQELGRTPVAVAITHGHLDHVGDAGSLSTYFDIPVFINPADSYRLDNPIDQLPRVMGEAVEAALPNWRWIKPRTIEAVPKQWHIAGITVDPLFAPGHTEGSTIYVNRTDGYAMTGDVLFAGTIGRTDLPGGNHGVMEETLRFLSATIAPDTVCYPGHGPATTMAEELRTNPYLER